MKVVIYIAVMLLAYCLTVDAGWFRRRRRSNSNNEVRADVRYDKDRVVGTGTWTHNRDNFESSVSGTVDNNGNWGVGASATWRFKRSTGSNEPELYNVTLHVDECKFITYDLNRDDIVIPQEFHAVFGDSEMAPALFNDLDSDENEVIDEEEFYENAPKHIGECVYLAVETDADADED